MTAPDHEIVAGDLLRAGSRLRYWLHEPRERPDAAPVVTLTHGVSLDHRTFDAQVGALVDGGYRTLTWDIRGHGASQPMGPEMSIALVVEDLIAVLDALEIERSVLVGQSFGGMVIQDALDRYPHRVSGLAVVGAPALGDRPGPLMRTLQRVRIPMVRLWPDRLLRATFVAMVTKDPEVRAYVADATAQLSKSAFLAVSTAAMEGYLRTERPAGHGRPLLLVQGIDEERPVARAIQRWADRDPRARHEVLEGGHLVNHESPQAFNQVLLAFCDDLVSER